MLSRPRIALAALAILALGGLARSDYSPIRAIMGPNSSTVGNVACWGDLFGLSLTDCGGSGSTVGTVATNAALKALAGGVYATVDRTGYAAANDVPAVTYTWNGGSSCTDDGGSCIQPNVGSGRWILTTQPRVHAGIFGALCNGSNDDTAALNNAVTYVQSLTGPGNVLLLSGRCKLSGAINITQNMSIEGAGRDSTFILPTASSFSCINFNPGVANRMLNLKGFSCSYPSLSSSGAAAITFGGSLFNSIDSEISGIDTTNATTGISVLNAINTTIHHNNIHDYYDHGIKINNPLNPDSGGYFIHDNFIENFNPLGSNSICLLWLSGGALNFHNNTCQDMNGVWMLADDETSENHILNNLITATGSSTAAVEITTKSASFTCSQTLTTMTVSAVTGTIVVQNAGGTNLGASVTGAGVGANTRFVTQLTGTPGGAGTYTMNVSQAVGSTTCLATVSLTEVVVQGNIFDGWDRALLVPVNTGGVSLFNLHFADNAISSRSGSAQNQITVNSTLGLMLSNNLLKCNGNCASGRAMLIGATVDKATIWQPTSSKIGSWGAADSISSTNTCGMLGNALVTTC